MRQKLETHFFKERRELITEQQGLKRQQIVALMQKYPKIAAI